ncbi:MAG: TnpV protein [Selenomonas sp.]|nr:TnpV protein [Selenomonas sp.]
MERIPGGEWTGIRYNYLCEEKPELLMEMRANGNLETHLEEVEDFYSERLWDLVERQMEREGVDEELKAQDPLGWVGRVNNIRAGVKEQLIAEICR